jgi:hypothetical protein
MNKIKYAFSFLLPLQWWKTPKSIFNCFSHSCDSEDSLPLSTYSLKDRQISLSQELTPQLNPSNLLSNTNKLERVVSVSSENDLFLITKPSTYSKMLEDFINYHGVNSPKVKSLISPEISLADRVTNIHTITGDYNFAFTGTHFLHKKESMNRLLESVSTDSLDISLAGVENILSNHHDALRIAVDILSN